MRSLTDAPVTVTGVEVNREGDGVSYVSLGFPGATVQLLQKLAEDNLADDLKRIAPDVIVLAFGTNEGFNDALDVAGYTAQYEQIVKRLKSLRPQARIVIIGPPDGAPRRCSPARTSRRAPTAASATCRRRPSWRRCAKRSVAWRCGSKPISGTGRRRCRAHAARRYGPPPTRR